MNNMIRSRQMPSLMDLLNVENNQQSTYPPYNIIKHNEENWSIELAVSGFTREELSVEVDKRVLTVAGKKTVYEKRDFEYRYQGIAYRNWTRKFTLEPRTEVTDVKLENGLLIINLTHVIPEEEKPRLIAIN